MQSRRHFLALAAAAATLPYAALANAPVQVVATTGMIADTASRIGGALVSVKGLMGAGVDPHSYRQTRQDIVAMTRADLVLWNGLYLEAQMEDFLLRLGKRQPVVTVTDLVQANASDRLMANADYSGAFDPHIWMDPSLWVLVAERISSALTELRPEAADRFAANLATFRAELEALDAYGKDALAQVPEDSRLLITAHDAFSYFGRAYGLEVLGVQGISTDSEAGLHRIGELVDVLVNRKVNAVFVESSVSDRNMRALIEGAAARGHEVRLGGQLFSDAMGPDGTYEGTFVGMIDHNITTIARALGADVPQGGWSGKLSAGS
jgi:manganese/zinc/iron transport system substrate-binding protein